MGDIQQRLRELIGDGTNTGSSGNAAVSASDVSLFRQELNAMREDYLRLRDRMDGLKDRCDRMQAALDYVGGELQSARQELLNANEDLKQTRNQLQSTVKELNDVKERTQLLKDDLKAPVKELCDEFLLATCNSRFEKIEAILERTQQQYADKKKRKKEKKKDKTTTTTTATQRRSQGLTLEEIFADHDDDGQHEKRPEGERSSKSAKRKHADDPEVDIEEADGGEEGHAEATPASKRLKSSSMTDATLPTTPKIQRAYLPDQMKVRLHKEDQQSRHTKTKHSDRAPNQPVNEGELLEMVTTMMWLQIHHDHPHRLGIGSVFMWDVPTKREEVLVCVRAMFLALPIFVAALYDRPLSSCWKFGVVTSAIQHALKEDLTHKSWGGGGTLCSKTEHPDTPYYIPIGVAVLLTPSACPITRHSTSSAPPRNSFQGGWLVVNRPGLLRFIQSKRIRDVVVSARGVMVLSHREDVRVREVREVLEENEETIHLRAIEAFARIRPSWLGRKDIFHARHAPYAAPDSQKGLNVDSLLEATRKAARTSPSSSTSTTTSTTTTTTATATTAATTTTATSLSASPNASTTRPASTRSPSSDKAAALLSLPPSPFLYPPSSRAPSPSLDDVIPRREHHHPHVLLLAPQMIHLLPPRSPPLRFLRIIEIEDIKSETRRGHKAAVLVIILIIITIILRPHKHQDQQELGMYTITGPHPQRNRPRGDPLALQEEEVLLSASRYCHN